jgi:hypothetical protein
MPTNLIHSLAEFQQEDTILASDVGLVSSRALTIDDEGVVANAAGNKIIRAGTVAYKLPSQTMGRVGLRTKTAEEITESTTTFKVVDQGVIYQTTSAAYFKPGDVLVELGNGDAIGVVESINYEDGEITLATASQNAVDSGEAIGVAAAVPYGLVVGPHDAGKADNDVACYTGGSIYAERLYYWDEDIAEAFKPGFTTV